jgi:flagellar hook-associated protein 2
MASIVSSGIGSGLDIAGLVKQLVTAEGQPAAARLDTQETDLQAKLSAFGSLRSAIANLQATIAPLKDAKNFQGRSVAVGDDSLLTATATSTAATGTFQIAVERLAQAAKLQSQQLGSADTVVGTGTLTLKLGASTMTLNIDGTNDTLAQIRDAINGASGNPGITATIVTGVDGAHLVLTSSKTGAANAITVTQSGGDGGLAPLVYDPANNVTNMTQVQQAADARVVIDGIAAESPTNSVTSAVDGLTLNLLATSAPNTTTTVSVSLDQSGTTKAVNDFVKAYNALVNGLQNLASYDATSKTAGPLLGDSTLRDFLTSLRRTISSTVGGTTGSYNNVAQIGIGFALDGTMTADPTKLADALNTQFDSVGQLFASTGGVAKRLDTLFSQYVSTGGLLDARTKGLQTSISEIGDQRTQLQTRLDALQTRLTAQFNAMDTLVAQLRSTSSFLTQQLAYSTATTSSGTTTTTKG